MTQSLNANYKYCKMLSGILKRFSQLRSCNCCILFYSFHPLVQWHISNGRQLMILLTIHLIFVHFSAEMITFKYAILRYGQYNDLFLFFDYFRIHKCYFSVITFAKLSGHAETSVALLQDKFSINYTTIPFNQVPCHRCYSNKSISYFFWDSRYGLFQLVLCATVAEKKILIYWSPRFMSLLSMH